MCFVFVPISAFWYVRFLILHWRGIPAHKRKGKHENQKLFPQARFCGFGNCADFCQVHGGLHCDVDEFCGLKRLEQGKKESKNEPNGFQKRKPKRIFG